MTLEAEEILGAEIEKIAQMQKIKTTLSPKMIISEEDSVASSEPRVSINFQSSFFSLKRSNFQRAFLKFHTNQYSKVILAS